MLLPIRTNILPKRTPYANYALIVVNVLIFLATYWPHVIPETGEREIIRLWAQPFELMPNRPQLWQFISYAFLHGGYMHILGNMYFLYLFGNNVNDKIGHISYICFYLAGAVFSGVGHVAFSSGVGVPTLGASGAVAAVTGAYLVLFPQTLITVLYWFFFIGTLDLPALYFIAIKMIFIDNVIVRYTPHVAYDAHLAGYAFGIVASLIVLATGLVQTSAFDLWAMLKRWNRRRQYRDALADSYDPFAAEPPDKRISVRQVNSTPLEQGGDKITQLREQISSRILQRNLPAAADLYLELMRIDSNQILPRQHILDIANQLAGEGVPRRAEAAQAYEQFLMHYGSYEYADQVELMLGILYSRYLNAPAQAIQHLQAAMDRLTDAGQRKMCQEELVRLKGAAERSDL